MHFCPLKKRKYNLALTIDQDLSTSNQKMSNCSHATKRDPRVLSAFEYIPLILDLNKNGNFTHFTSCNDCTVNSQFKKVNFSFLKSRVYRNIKCITIQ